MRGLRDWIVVGLLIGLAFSLTGCKLFSKLPDTTWKLNRGPAMDEGPAYFSVPDPDSPTDG